VLMQVPNVPLKRCAHTGVTIMSNIDQSCTWTMPLAHYSKSSMSTLRIWVFKSDVLKYLFSVSMVRNIVLAIININIRI
jgi:hypothetical protein